MEYFVYITNDCNLNCGYCSVLNDGTQTNFPIRPIYSTKDLIEFIDRTQRGQDDSEVIVYLFGGEPSLEYLASMRLINDLKIELQKYSMEFILHTNGLLLHEIPDELLSQLNTILCSVNYEKIPHYYLCSSYFSQVMNNVILTKKRKNITIIGRLTITEKTSLYTEALQFAHFFDYIYWQIENKPTFANYKKFYTTYTFETKITFAYWMQYLQNGFLLKYIPFMAATRFLLFHDRSDKVFSCGYGSGMIYVQTDGTCYACSDSDKYGVHHIGSISKDVNLTKPSLLQFRCASCGYRYLCLGRCGRMHKEFTKKQVSRYCALNRFMFKLFIRNKKEFKKIVTAHPHIADELKRNTLGHTEFTP